MKKLILSAAVAAFALGVVPSFADDMAIKVVKTKLPEGCEYKKVAGHKKKQVVCIDEMTENGGGAAIDTNVADSTSPADSTPATDGKSGNPKGANNGKGNGTADGTPGHSTPKDTPQP